MRQNILEERDSTIHKIYIGWSAIEEFVDDLCYQIKTNYPEIKYVHGLKRGGLIPAVLISHTLGFKICRHPRIL